jgi:aldehyde:ferredoxin oxidoreductase
MKRMILVIDLSSRGYEFEEISEHTYRKYIGGRGLGAYLSYRHIPPGIDPFDEKNCVIFTAGPANGTPMFYSSKVNMNTKSPLTGVYLYSISSGVLSHQMRKAGVWGIVIKGISDSPVYIRIQNERVDFRDATPYWGTETALGQKLMLEGSDPRRVATLGIGPGGERKIPSAGIFCDGPLYRCFGRGGSGAVMGSKKLKGVVVAGERNIQIASPARIRSLNRKISALLKTDFREWARWWRQYETGADLEWMNRLGILPARNWQAGQFEAWKGIDKSRGSMAWPNQGRACGPFCPTPGCREVEVSGGVHKGARSDFEWETIYAFGSCCGIDKMEPIVAASQICDEAGIDTITAGVTIAFAMECYERGLIDSLDTEGIDLRFGNDRGMLQALRKLVNLEGFGTRLAEGTRGLSQERLYPDLPKALTS